MIKLMIPLYRILFFIVCFLSMGVVSPAFCADDMPTYHVSMKDGVFTPAEIQVKEGVKFRLEIENLGKGPAEFENLMLHKEKPLAPASQGSLVFHGLDKGSYEFTDDWHPSKDKPFRIVVS